jgi:hypothetical protein
MGDFIRVHCRHCDQTYLTVAENSAEGGVPIQCDLCRQSGGVVGGDTAQREAERQPRDQTQPRGPFPVSAVCPNCGGKEFRTTRPERWIAYTLDRVCKSCGTRYSPPTPRWAGIIFIILGFPLVAIGLFGVVASLMQGSPCPLVCEGPLGFLGILAIAHGIHTLTSPERT